MEEKKMRDVHQKLVEKEKKAEKAKQELMKKQIEKLKLNEIKAERIHKAAEDHKLERKKALKDMEREKEFKD
jgi:hypothetical protein